MASSLSSLVDTLAERIYKNKCKDCDCFFEYERVQDTLIKRKCLSCNKIVQTRSIKNWESNLRTHLSFLIMIYFVVKKRYLLL